MANRHGNPMYISALERAYIEQASRPTPEQTDELEELKAIDPDSYLEQRQKIVADNERQQKQYIEALRNESAQQAAKSSLERLAEKGVQLTPDFIQNQVPASWTQQLGNGAISEDEFLGKINKLVETGIVPKEGIKIDTPNLGDVGGSGVGQAQEPKNTVLDDYISGELTY